MRFLNEIKRVLNYSAFRPTAFPPGCKDPRLCQVAKNGHTSYLGSVDPSKIELPAELEHPPTHHRHWLEEARSVARDDGGRGRAIERVVDVECPEHAPSSPSDVLRQPEVD